MEVHAQDWKVVLIDGVCEDSCLKPGSGENEIFGVCVSRVLQERETLGTLGWVISGRLKFICMAERTACDDAFDNLRR